jgi:hypothetical protein
MGRGLSALQREILLLALPRARQRSGPASVRRGLSRSDRRGLNDAAERLRRAFERESGAPSTPWRTFLEGSPYGVADVSMLDVYEAYYGWSWPRPGHPGEPRIVPRALSAAVSRAMARLARRGLATRINRRYWSAGVRLTPEGMRVARRLELAALRPRQRARRR